MLVTPTPLLFSLEVGKIEKKKKNKKKKKKPKNKKKKKKKKEKKKKLNIDDLYKIQIFDGTVK